MSSDTPSWVTRKFWIAIGGHVLRLAFVGVGRDRSPAGRPGRRSWRRRRPGSRRRRSSSPSARSRSADTPRPADCSVTSSWRFFISSTDSPNGRYSTLPRSPCTLRPAALSTARALSSVPDFGAPDRDALALQVGQRLDARVGAGDDLDVVRVDAGDAAQLLERRLEAGFLVALPRVGEGVAEREGDLAAAGLQQVQVLDRRLGRLHRRPWRPGMRLADRSASATPSG